MNEELLLDVRKNIEGKEWSEIPGVKESRAAYKAFGRNPGCYCVSYETLLRRVCGNDELYHISSFVDVNNLISVESGLSVGSYDLENIHGDIIFCKAENGEGYNRRGKYFIYMKI